MDAEISEFVIGDKPYRLVQGWGEATHLARIGRNRAICGYEEPGRRRRGVRSHVWQMPAHRNEVVDRLAGR